MHQDLLGDGQDLLGPDSDSTSVNARMRLAAPDTVWQQPDTEDAVAVRVDVRKIQLVRIGTGGLDMKQGFQIDSDGKCAVCNHIFAVKVDRPDGVKDRQ